jgi:hypothetical protein
MQECKRGATELVEVRDEPCIRKGRRGAEGVNGCWGIPPSKVSNGKKILAQVYGTGTEDRVIGGWVDKMWVRGY